MRVKSLWYGVAILIICTILIPGTGPAGAAEWPSEPIHLLVGWGAGGSTDLISRMLAESLTKSLGVPVMVENKTGAAGLLALSLISKARPDGYTIGFMSGTAVSEKPFLREVPFDPLKGFSYIAQVFNYGYGFCVKPDSPWKTFPEFVEAAKRASGRLTYATSGLGSTMHVAMAKLEEKIPGFKVTHVPIKESPKVVSSVMGGHVDSCFQTPEWKPYVDAGQLRLLAAPQRERWKDYPNVPTWLDLGYGVYAHSPGAYVAPPGLPEAIRGRLEQEFKKAMDYPGLKSVTKQYSIIEVYKPGKEVYEELIRMHNENKAIVPKLGIVEK